MCCNTVLQYSTVGLGYKLLVLLQFTNRKVSLCRDFIRSIYGILREWIIRSVRRAIFWMQSVKSFLPIIWIPKSFILCNSILSKTKKYCSSLTKAQKQICSFFTISDQILGTIGYFSENTPPSKKILIFKKKSVTVKYRPSASRLA